MLHVQILTALSGDAEAEVQQSLKEDVDIMLDSIRAEVAASVDSEVAMDVEDTLQVRQPLCLCNTTLGRIQFAWLHVVQYFASNMPRHADCTHG